MTRCRPRVCVSRYSPGTTSAQIVDTAFTPPISATAMPERAQPARTDPRPCNVLASGSTAHGTSRPGRAAADVDPITIVNVGHSTKTTPASSLEASEPIRSVVASLVMPQNPAATSSESQSRSTTHTGSCSACPSRKNGAIGIA